jgi:phytoene/squalene synthetase
MVAAEIMGAIYRGILDRIQAVDYDVFSRVIRVPRPQRALIAGTVWLRMLAIGR